MGNTDIPSEKGTDGVLVKTDARGKELGRQVFGGADDEYTAGFQVTADGGCVLVGFTQSYGARGQVWLVKTDANLNQVWSKAYGGALTETGQMVQQTSDGGYTIMAVRQTEPDEWPSELFLIETDSSGVEQSQKPLSIDFDIWETEGLFTPDGGYLVFGDMPTSEEPRGRAHLTKLNEAGSEEWRKTFGTSGDGFASVHPTQDGGYILAGYTNSFALNPGPTAVDLLLVKLKDFSADPALDFNGSGVIDFSDFLVLAKAYGTGEGDAGYEARADLDGDRKVAFSDFLLFAKAYGRKVKASKATHAVFPAFRLSPDSGGVRK